MPCGCLTEQRYGSRKHLRKFYAKYFCIFFYIIFNLVKLNKINFLGCKNFF
jgi:hypothetical protein